MLYLGPKTAGGWLQKIAIAAHKKKCKQELVLPTASQVSSISMIDGYGRPGVEISQSSKLMIELCSAS